MTRQDLAERAAALRGTKASQANYTHQKALATEPDAAAKLEGFQDGVAFMKQCYSEAQQSAIAMMGAAAGAAAAVNGVSTNALDASQYATLPSATQTN